MAIDFKCWRCRYPVRLRDGEAGGRIDCPDCGAVLDVPDGREDYGRDGGRYYRREPHPDLERGGGFTLLHLLIILAVLFGLFFIVVFGFAFYAAAAARGGF